MIHWGQSPGPSADYATLAAVCAASKGGVEEILRNFGLKRPFVREKKLQLFVESQRRHQTSCWRYCLSDAANTNHTDVLYLFIGNEMSVTVKLDFEVPSQEALNLELHWIYICIFHFIIPTTNNLIVEREKKKCHSTKLGDIPLSHW